MPDTQVGEVGEGAPPPPEPARPPRRHSAALNGTEQRLDAVLEVLDEIAHLLRELRLDGAGLDQVKEGDPVLELTEPATADPVENPAPPAEPIEIVEPTPGPARPAARPTKKAAAKKKAAPHR